MQFAGGRFQYSKLDLDLRRSVHQCADEICVALVGSYKKRCAAIVVRLVDV